MPHVHELYDFTTSAFIAYNGTILLVQHKKIGKWLQPGGHIELDEDPLEALWREIEEETGLTKSHLEIVQQQPE
jgi:8-oxo-dGTP pyrophosphatase MutT (NUDIX family)